MTIMVTRRRETQFIETVAPSPKTQTELRRRVRSLSYSDATLAVEWLNATIGKPAYRRVLAVRQKLADLSAALETLSDHNQSLRGKRPQTIKEFMNDNEVVRIANLQERFRKDHNALNEQLARYIHIPALAYDLDAGIWRFGMVPKRQRLGPEIVIEDQSLRIRVNESSVVTALARLAANRELYKVRMCPQCKKRWRVSEREIDRFCGQKCREAYHITSAEYLDKKAANQREYRRREKEGKKAGAAAFRADWTKSSNRRRNVMPRAKERDGVYERPDRPGWWVSYMTAEGERVRKKVTASTLTQALDCLQRLKYGDEREAALGVRSESDITTEDLFARFVKYQKVHLRPRTFQGLDSILKVLKAHLPVLAKSITKGSVSDYITTRMATPAWSMGP